MSAHFVEWLNLFIRWIHVTAGVAWVGASFYFTFLENSLNRKKDLREGLAGNLWAIHGGGFYYLEKYKDAPTTIPEDLHWFKWEAYTTWISGMALLVVVYYLNAGAYLLTPNQTFLTPGWAITVGLSSIAAGWLIYDAMCKSALLDKPLALSFIGFTLVTLWAYLLCQLFGSRAAYIHVGAMLGTLMAGNVFRVIIPSQKALVEAAKKKQPYDLKLGVNAGKRSRHNNYITLPVIFIMISSHFPSTYGNEFNWAILAALSLGSALVRHYFNTRKESPRLIWILPWAVLAFITLAFITEPKRQSAKDSTHIEFSQVKTVIEQRCQMCHSSKPSDPLFQSAPNGVILVEPAQLKAFADRIYERVVVAKTMPFANRSGMSDAERELIGNWVTQGAKLDN